MVLIVCMAKKKTSKKNSKKQKQQVNIIEHVKQHMLTEVGIPAAAIVVLLILVLVKVPYQAQEQYTEIEQYEEPVQKVVPGETREERICEQTPAQVTVTSHYNYIRPFGTSEYKCYSEFKVTNQEDTDGKWTYRYIFDVSGKEVITDPEEELIPRLGSITYYFESDVCEREDSVDGTYELVDGPMTTECRYEMVTPNVTVTEMETREREVQKTRIITKYEPLWQKILGYNSHEKI